MKIKQTRLKVIYALFLYIHCVDNSIEISIIVTRFLSPRMIHRLYAMVYVESNCS